MNTFRTHVGKSINIPFIVVSSDGITADGSTSVNVQSVNPAIRVGVLPGDPRTAFVDGLIINASGANVDVSATIDGKFCHDSFLVIVDPAPNESSVTVANIASDEYPTPASR